jgi:hypothetical protein
MCTCAILLHHDNGSTHASLKTTEFVTNNMVVVLHSAYSLDLASQIEKETEGMIF